jgi:hypothetical protein
MILSFGELESLSFKAARGAGLDWGLAEEAAKAVRWLAERGLPGAEALAVHLPQIAGKSYAQLRPLPDADHWRPAGEALCPLITGSALSDHAVLLPDKLTLEPVLNPLLLVPFVARVAERLGRPLALDWSDTQIICGSGGLSIEGDSMVTMATLVTITHAENAPQNLAGGGRRPIEPAVLDVLQRLAHRTYVPATEASRLAGAGAGTSDND